MGIRKENGSIYAYAEGVQEHVASDYAAQYRRVARIYQKAAYSSSKTAQEERDQVRAYKDGLLQMIRRRCSFMKRIKLKWISGLY